MLINTQTQILSRSSSILIDLKPGLPCPFPKPRSAHGTYINGNKVRQNGARLPSSIRSFCVKQTLTFQCTVSVDIYSEKTKKAVASWVIQLSYNFCGRPLSKVCKRSGQSLLTSAAERVGILTPL